jgi:RNase P/RNase MRP subunit POP5
MKLKPSARLNRRYLLIRGTKENVETAILEYIGVLGWAKSAPAFLSHSGGCILAINRGEIVNVRAALALTKENIEVLRVSGTLKGLSKSKSL